MTQNCWMVAAFALAALLMRGHGSLQPAAGGQGGDAAAPKPRRYTLADLVEDPAILVGMGCWDGDRRTLLETFGPRERYDARPSVALSAGPDFLP